MSVVDCPEKVSFVKWRMEGFFNAKIAMAEYAEYLDFLKHVKIKIKGEIFMPGVDLLGTELTESFVVKGSDQKFRVQNKYRESFTEENCKSCFWMVKFPYHNEKHFKCRMQKINRTSATDIILKNVCNKWRSKDEV